MRRLPVLMTLLAAAACGGSGSGGGGAGSGGGPVDGEPSQLSGITAAHNAARAAVDPPAATPIPPLGWDNSVATTAQAWSDKCQFMHSGGQYGENIYASAGAIPSAQDVVGSWVSEKKDYDYASNSCSGVCGHYTQVVWAKSLKLGCGFSTCTQNSPFGGGTWYFVVCNYDPPGNFVGEKPY